MLDSRCINNKLLKKIRNIKKIFSFNYSDTYYCNSRNVLRLAVTDSILPTIKGEFDTNIISRGVMDSFYNDPMFSTNPNPLGVYGWSLREKNHTSFRSNTLHHRLGAGHRSKVSSRSLRGQNVLWSRLRYRVHRRPHVHRRDCHKWS